MAGGTSALSLQCGRRSQPAWTPNKALLSRLRRLEPGGRLGGWLGVVRGRLGSRRMPLGGAPGLPGDGPGAPGLT
eukprot:4791396-Pyramimonas_sp.AAC.1